jgi:hypothetical protein
VVQIECGNVKSVGLDVAGVNTPCRLARRIARRIRAGCGARVGDRCDVGDNYRCGVTEVTDEWMEGRCLSRRDAFFVVVFTYVFPP